MPCPADSFTSAAGSEVVDLLELHAFRAGVQYIPRNKAELVAAVAAATPGTRSLRGLGTRYSLSLAHVADDVVSTDALRMHLSPPFPAATGSLPSQRLRDAGNDFLRRACNEHSSFVTGRHFVHVEAGIKTRQLLQDLKACGLALPTMGAGGGQSLAGALSTATHGADFRVPPLVEWIRALHLVGSGGQEWWITPNDSIFSSESLLSEVPGWCFDTRIIRNDDAFNAARVAVGRMGVIYSMIIEVVPEYGLLEVNFEHPWSEIEGQLNAGVFDVPLTDLESGWFFSEVRNRTLVRYSGPTPEPTQATAMEYVGGPARGRAPIHSTLEPSLFRQMLARLELEPLAAKLRGSSSKELHHLNIVVSLTQPERCWVTRRWRVPADLPPVFQIPTTARPNPILPVVEHRPNHRKPTALIEPLRSLLMPDFGVGGPGPFWPFFPGLGDIFVHFGLSDKANRIKEFRDNDVARIATMSEQAGATIGEALFLILYKLATDPILRPESTSDVQNAVSALIGGDTVAKLLRCGHASDILDTHDYDLDGAQSGNSAEFFFDASRTEYLTFIKEIMRLSRSHAPVFGYIGIRFTPNSTALIAMQQFNRTVSVEVSTARSRLEDVYKAFWVDVHSAAGQVGGIPHWGQEFRQSAATIRSHYGEDLSTWCQMLAELSTQDPTLFSTSFSRAAGLEPGDATGMFDIDPTTLFMLGLQAGSDYPQDSVASDTLLALLTVGIDFSVEEADLMDWLNNPLFTPYPALAEALLKLLEGKHLRQPVYLDVIRFKYEDVLGASSPRSVADVDFALLRAAVLEGFNERYGEAVTDFQSLVR